MSDTLPRDQSLFLFQHGWKNPVILPQDGSSRSYARVYKDDRTAMFCWYGPNYNTLDYYLEVDTFMKANNLRTPEIYAADIEKGFVLLEDFGDFSMKKAMTQGADKTQLYQKALKVLDQIRAIDDLPPMKDFYASTAYVGTRRVIDWYLPATRKQANDPAEAKRYMNVWQDIEKSLQPPKQGMVYVDLHAENIHVLEDGSFGLIDFHDPMTNSPCYGPQMYDLAHLLYDMRMEVPENIKQEATKNLSQSDKDWLIVLATIFHCRLLGQCIRWAIVDNKLGYLAYLPRLENYVLNALKNPVLKPLKAYFEDLGLDFTTSQTLNIEEIKQYIAPDAF